MKVSASIFSSHYSAHKALRETITWTKANGLCCGRCGGEMLLGTLDADQVARACQDCPVVSFQPSSSSSSSSQSAAA
jgi:hypothetical protein